MKKFNVLITHEKSGASRRAFRAKRVNAYSCDIRPADDCQEHHLQMDAMDAINNPVSIVGEEYWDLIIMHPVCQSLAVSGNHVYAFGKPKHHLRLKSMKEVEELWKTAKKKGKKVALENPLGVLGRTLLGKATQRIQPYDFGEDASKLTCLWLYNLEPLIPTKRINGRKVLWKGKVVERWSNQCDSGQNILGPSEDRADIRAETYPGIADAFTQWIPL